MTNKQIIKLINAIKTKNPSLPIIECAVLQDDTIYVSSLDHGIIIPFKHNTTSTILISDLVYLLGLFDAPVLIAENRAIIVDTGIERFEFNAHQDIGEYPRCVACTAQLVEIGKLTKESISILVSAMAFTGNDELRPIMANVYFDDDIVATDAHMVFKEKNPNKPSRKILFPKPVINALNVVKTDWSIYKANETKTHIEIMLISTAGIKIFFRMPTDRYPDYNAVMPTSATTTITVSVVSLMSAVEKAKRFSNKTNMMVVFDFIYGAVFISAEDDDYQKKYSRKIDLSSMGGKNLKIGFNPKFLLKVLPHITGDVEIKMREPNQAAIINSKYLVMPKAL